MFRFFRRLRSDVLSEKWSLRYLRYAIGELVLVVFGILIALQINNWNEDRIEQRQITEYAHALIAVCVRAARCHKSAVSSAEHG